ncbi:MAG: hypothetical protein KKA62_04055 [Nanoarchaeota archaeon]|nr:hypothetical protein [Nanoarchaeota archaeon]MBU1977097.1 hypothetical protein [Nanoarchaeota archaeon]
MTEKFDPFDVKQYEGIAFITQSGNRYTIKDSCFYGRDSVEGARIKMVSGGTKLEALCLRNAYLTTVSEDLFDSESFQQIHDYISGVSKPIRPGLYLMVIFDEDSARKHNRHGITTSLVEKMEKV